jgi:hypothetical protein
MRLPEPLIKVAKYLEFYLKRLLAICDYLRKISKLKGFNIIITKGGVHFRFYL